MNDSDMSFELYPMADWAHLIHWAMVSGSRGRDGDSPEVFGFIEYWDIKEGCLCFRAQIGGRIFTVKMKGKVCDVLNREALFGVLEVATVPDADGNSAQCLRYWARNPELLTVGVSLGVPEVPIEAALRRFNELWRSAA